MRPRRSAIPFLVLLAPVVFVGSAPAPAVSASGAPRPTNGAGSRREPTGAVRPEVGRLVTGSPVHLQSVVAGTPPTAVMKVVPVAAKVGFYPGGTTIVGNELRAPAGGFRAWFEFKLSHWDPDGDNVPPLRVWQFRVDNTGYKGENADPSNPGVDLTPPVIACANNAACVMAFGEAWAKCNPYFSTCQAAYVDRAGTGRADSWCADTGSGACEVADCDTMTELAPRCFAILPQGVGRPDAGIEYYGATVVLDIPAGAEGKYTVNLGTDETFLADTGSPSNDIPTLSETGFVVNILPGTFQACCLGMGGCSDLDSADCANAGGAPQGQGTDCLQVQCSEPTGSCCNTSTSSCTDDVLQADCSPPLEWMAYTLCVNLPSPCLPTGACCDSSPGAGGPGSEGACTDNQLEVDCTGPNKVWTRDATCAEVTCVEVVGACCDPRPGAGGICWEGLLQAQCMLLPRVWTQGEPCAGIVCEETRGSCWNTTTFACTNNVLQGDCQGADLVWKQGITCEAGPEILLTPVPAKVGSYPSGTTIVGNELTAFTGGFRAWFELKLSHWDPDGDNVPPLHVWQFRIDTNGYKGENADPSNPGVDLTPPVIACANNAACVTAFGEPWASCELYSGTCNAAYVERAGTGRPDSWCADTGSGACEVADCDTMSELAPRCFAIYPGVRPDAGIEYYGATVVLDIPAGAQGKYTVNLATDETFLADTGNPLNYIPTLAETGFVVNIALPPPDLMPDPEGDKTRGISFSALPPAVATGAPGQTAIRVTMVELHHPNPRNAPQFPPPNASSYSTFDTNTNGVCSGAAQSPNYNGHPCNTNADCVSAGGLTNGVCSSLVACTAAGESVPPNASGQGGCARWVGRPGTFFEAQNDQTIGQPYRAARLQCTPFYYDWVTETATQPITVVGAEIMPSSEYSVQTYGASCKGSEGSCANVSAVVTMFTGRHGDLASVFNPPDPSVQPDAIDVAKIVDSFKKLSTGLVKAIGKITPNLPEENNDVDSNDISAVVDAAKGYAYKFGGPCPCPSAATCGALACPTGADGLCTGSALPGLGAEAKCIKTCTGGPNDGEPCLNGKHCGNTCAMDGGPKAGQLCDSDPDCGTGHICTIVGTCGTPLCRDRCGRCKP